MHQRLERSHGNVLGYELTGRIGEDEYKRLTDELRARMTEHGSVRLLVRAHGFPAPELSAVDDDFRFARDHLDDIDRCAVVGDRKLLELLVRAGDKVVGTEIRHFGPEHEEDAWAWLEG